MDAENATQEYTRTVYSPAIEEALLTGACLVRKAWVNENSTKNQLSVQFMQRIETPSDGTSNKLIGIAQGGSSIPDAGFTRATTILSFDIETAKGLGIEPGDYSQGEKAMLANDVFGTEVNIQVVENFEANPNAAQQTPKINPSTGDVVLSGGQEVYRHTELVEGSANNCWLKSDPSNAVAAVDTTGQSM